MVFSSVPPVYLDPPNWHHHHHHLLQQQQPDVHQERNGEPLSPAAAGSNNNNNNNKPGSMSERARVAKIPQPETALKCPRCESTNTKFCYFNNYNLSQPRHFCKTCRRYWTRGGALRNVPVGGGCRRNKKISKKTTSSSSKSRGGGNISTTTHEKQSSGTTTAHHNNFPPQSPFLSSLHNLGPFGGLNLRGIQAQMGSVSAHDSILSADQWSSGGIMQNFPFLAGGFHQPAAINSNHMFTFQNEGTVNEAITRPGRVSEAAKVEESQLGLSSAATSFLGNNSNNQFYSNSWGGGHGNMWSGNGAADQLPGQQLNSSGSGDATTHYL